VGESGESLLGCLGWNDCCFKRNSLGLILKTRQKILKYKMSGGVARS